MKLVSEKDPTVVKRSFDLLPHLETESLGRVVEIHESLTSTNDRALQLAREGAVHGVAVVALTQTKGRGQHGRVWHSPPAAGLYTSFVIRPSLSPRMAPSITILAGLAVRDALQSVLEPKVEVKWPNDVLVDSKKLAGILVEASTDSFRIDHAVVGIGVNLDDTEFPEHLTTTATTLQSQSAEARAPDAILGRIANHLERRLDQAAVDGLAPIARDFTRHMWRIGQPATLKADDAHIAGTLTGIAEDGALLLQTPEGTQPIYRGELTFT